MGFFLKCGSTVSALIAREVNLLRPIAPRLLLAYHSQGRGNPGHGAEELEMGCGAVGQELPDFLTKNVDGCILLHPSSMPAELSGGENGYVDVELNSQVGLRSLSSSLDILQEVKNCGYPRFEARDVEELKYRGLDSKMEERTKGCDSESVEDPEIRVLGIGLLAPGTGSEPNSWEIGHVKETYGRNVECNGNGNFAAMECRADEGNTAMVNEFSKACVSSKDGKFTTSEDAKDGALTDPAQNHLSRSSGNLEGDSQWPVPLSPLAGEVAKSIEYERAMVAEAAMKSGLMIGRDVVLFEDEWLMVINKPCGIYCEHVLATIPSLLTSPAALQARGSSLSRLALCQPTHNEVPRLHMANRLDRDTSGVMVITKCRNAAGKLSNIFTRRQVKKSYIALCSGPRPSWKSLTIDSGHGRSRFGAWRVYAKKDVSRGLPGGSMVRDMITHLLVMAVNKQVIHDDHAVGRNILSECEETEHSVTAGDESSSAFLQQRPHDKLTGDSTECCENDEVVIRAIPLTGRTHQIRLHCQFVGLSLRGDVKYGGPHSLNGVRYDHHALHAESLSFKHPFTFEELHFVTPLPEWATAAGVQPLILRYGQSGGLARKDGTLSTFQGLL